MMGNEISERVRAALARLEAERKMRVLYACESGSRAWGFASPNSDYDVRFLYVQERDWYLSIEERRDVVEQPLEGELDLSGWELRKALRLLRRSNPPLLEWLQSPVVYAEEHAFTAELRALAAAFYSPRRCLAHYRSMAAGNWRGYIRERAEVRLKKYLYVLRPLLACRWIERRRSQVPMRFAQLVEEMLEEREVQGAVEELVAWKQRAEELATAPPIPVLSQFIEHELSRLGTLPEVEDAAGDVEQLNGFFRRFALVA